MPTLHSDTHCQAAQTQAWRQRVSFQPRDQNDRQNSGRKRTPKR